ncbi:DUF4625 domain-containing protein [Labilibacter sediminis]|nr:DUF4625 domain-containing protein [Labilibacter sediminis]
MKIYFPKMISFFAVGFFMLTACGGGSDPKPEDPVDEAKPTISTDSPTEGLGIAMTEPFVYKGTFEDDVELSKVVFSLKDQKPAGVAGLKAATGVDDNPWEPAAETVTLSGNSKTLDQNIFTADYKDDGSGTMGIPRDVYTGEYILTITCTDKAGNETVENITVEIQ